MDLFSKVNFIDEWTKRLSEYTDAPEVFIRLSGYYLVSATLGEFFSNKLVPIGSSRPNVFIILSSMPGRMRRSTVQRITFKAFEQIIGSETVQQMIIEGGSPEGIMDHIGEEPNLSYTIQSTEIGPIMTGMYKGTHYSYGVSGLFAKLYYGEGGKQSLSKRGDKGKSRYIPWDLYVTLFGGMQEPRNYISEFMITQGLLRRILIAYVSEGSMKNWKEPINLARQDFNVRDLVAKIQSERQHYLESQEKVNVLLRGEAQDKINEYARKLDSEVDKQRDNISLYKQSLWEHELKLATLNAIACRKPQPQVHGELILDVVQKDVEVAEALLKLIEPNMLNIVENIGFTEKDITTHRTAEEKVFRYIHEVGSLGIGFHALGNKFPGVKRNDIDNLVENLRNQGKVVCKFPKLGGAGRPPRVLVAKEYENDWNEDEWRELNK